MLNREVIAIILGGGAGTRLFPLTKVRSKPAVPLVGKYRLIDIPISNCINSGINRMFVATQFNSASLNRHISTAYRFDSYSNGFVTILAAEQTLSSKEWFQGTADAVRQSLHYIDSYSHSQVLILSGDQLYSMNYAKMLQHHQENEADITIATIPVTAKDASGFGILKTDDKYVINEFREKPPQEELEGLQSYVNDDLKKEGRVYLASMGIYIFNRKVLRKELDENAFTDFGKEIIPNAINNRKVISFPFNGYWSDIGTIRSFYEANLDLAKRQPAFDLYNPDMPMYTHARMLPASKLQSTFIQDSIVAEGCIIINSQISNSVIGVRSYIGNNTTVKNSVIMGADYYSWHDRASRDFLVGADAPGIHDETYIEAAIIDKNVHIGKKCIIKNRDNVQEGEGPNFFIRDGIVIIPKNATIPDGTII
ncbi:glucose-1-phosphate adenylyltransferase [Candidatus Uabimicrobium sp. HlEnr_7]|uniref:glucose-1-phosphate adenylyltransferase n=1 Tax=Candidatus Uabimicrobium helgolandensis TaxID=3095367 RepID=UPI003556A75F